VERSSRFTMLLHLPPMDGRDGPRVKNGPAMTGHGAAAVHDAITALPDQLRRSLTWDQARRWPSTRGYGSTPACRCTSAIRRARGQRGTNENTSGLLRQYFPKRTRRLRA
jgi:IS30 family transposase